MLTNATLVSYTPAAGVNPNGGGRTLGAAVEVGAPCTLTAPTRAQRISEPARYLDVHAVLYVLKASLPAGVTPREGGRVAAALASTPDDAQAFEVNDVIDREHAGQSHYQLLLKRAA